MTLSNEDRKTVEELIAQKMDILSAFRGLPAAQKEELAANIGPFLYNRQYALRKPKNVYTPRWTVAGADINADQNGVGRGHAGPTLPRWIDMVGATGYLDAEDAQMLHIRAGGGAFCYDFLVAADWASVVSAGGGTEGQSFTDQTGRPFIIYSTVDAACDAAVATAARKTIFICPATYAEDVTISATSAQYIPCIYGGDMRNTRIRSMTITGGASDTDRYIVLDNFTVYGNGSTVFTDDVASGGDRRIYSRINFGASGGTVSFQQKDNVLFDRCKFGNNVTFSNNTNCAMENCELVGVDLNLGGTNQWCRFTNINTSGRILVTGGLGAGLADCTFDGVTFTGVSSVADCIEVGVSGTARMENVTFVNCNLSEVPVTTAAINLVSLISSRVTAIAVVACSFGTHGAAPALKSIDADVVNVVFSNNTVHPDGSGLYIEDNGGSTVSGNFGQSVFGPNAPSNKITYNVTGSNNLFIPGTAASGSSTGGTAPDSAPYVTIGNVASLSAERALTAGSGIGLTDGGANAAATLALGNLLANWAQTGNFGIYHAGHMQVGSSSAPGATTAGDLTAKRVFINNDANFNLQMIGTTPATFFDANDYFSFSRATNEFGYTIGGSAVYVVSDTRVALTIPMLLGGSGSPAASALLDMASSSQGFLAPRMSTAQRDAIASPATGLFIYNATNNQFEFYNGTAWKAVGSAYRRQYVWAPDAAPGAAVTAGNQQGNIYHSGPDGMTAEKLYVDAETAPGASGLPITVQYGDTDDLDTVTAWTQIATLTLSSEKSSSTTTMTNAAVPANRLLRMNVGTIVGSPADVTVTLEGKALVA